MSENIQGPFPYRSRNGEHVSSHVETILGDPEFQLTEEERQQLSDFSHDLFNGRSSEHVQEIHKGLTEVVSKSASASIDTFYLDYFSQDTEQVQRDKEALGLSAESSSEEVRRRLYDIDLLSSTLPFELRGEIAERSRKWYITSLANHLSENAAGDSNARAGESLTINFDPSVLIEKIRDLQKFRNLYREERRLLKDNSDHLSHAKRTVADLYLGRINSLLADIYPDLVYLIEQQESSDHPEKEEILRQIEEVAPVVSRATRSRSTEQDQTISRLMTRLDYLYNGASELGTETDEKFISPISPSLLELATELSKSSQEISPNASEPLLPPEVIEQLDATSWDAHQLENFLEAVLKKWDVLSANKATWDEVKKRSGPCEDGRYQVVIALKDSLSVDTIKRVVYVPKSFNRNLTAISPGGVLPIAVHELTHVLQGIADTELSKTVPLAQIKGRGYLTLREGGGVYQEQDFHRRYLGRERPVNLHYLRALQAKLQGGNIMQVARAFYESAGAKPTQKAKETAVDRALRLFRQHGQNSQPLDYIEQAIIVKGLDTLPEEQVQGFLIQAGSFNLQDLSALRANDILPAPSATDLNPVDDVMQVFFEQFYEPPQPTS